MEPAKPDLRQQMQQLIYGFFTSQTLYAAARLEVADVLADGPRTSAEVAAATGGHAESVHRLLRALAFLGVLYEPAPGTYALTERGELLRTGVIGSMRQLVLLLAGPESWGSWGALEHSVRTGGVAWEHVFRENSFDYLAARPDRQAMFNAAMTEGAHAFVPSFLAACDLSDFGTVVDVGGGCGALLAGILVAHPRLRGVLFDTETGLEEAPKVLADAGVVDRCALVAGDFFQGVPGGGDAYILKSVLHDWNDQQCVAILTACRQSIPDSATLFLVESLMPTSVTTSASIAQVIMNDLNMMVCHGGKERTVPEFRALLHDAGFRLESVTPCPAPSTVGVLGAIPARRA